MTKPKQIGKYEILEEIGRGGFAVVYKARDTTLDRIVALKVLAPHLSWEPEFAEQFRREAKAVARLRHPNVVFVHEIGEEEGQLYIAMEYLQGRTLAQILTEEGTLPLEQAASILEQMANALDHAHGKGVLHRDIKPGNIMVMMEEGERAGPHATLMDFGLVKAIEGSRYVRSSGRIVGTPEYMSPEQAENEELDHRSDLYSLGVVAYQMCTGEVPFSAPSPLVVLRCQADKPPPSPQELNPYLPATVERVLLKALAKKREERYQSAGEMAQALRKAVEAEEQARKERRAQPAPPWWTRRLGVLLVLLVLLTAGGVLLGQPLGVQPTAVTEPTITPRPIVATTVMPTDTTTPTPSPTRTPTKTTRPTATETSVSRPTLTPTTVITTTATATKAPIPTDTRVSATTPVLTFPEQGRTYRNAGTFQWQGTLASGQTYLVRTWHPGTGFSTQSPSLSTTSWTISLPQDKFGEWRWDVSVLQGGSAIATSTEGMFWLSPFPPDSHAYP
jgi:serine/threonine protein kinase